MKNNPKISGKNGNNWKGGITSLNKKIRVSSEYKEWRLLVIKRDNYTCQNENCKFCKNKRGEKLQAHHIKHFSEFPDLIFDINNGITYCKRFHLKSGLHKRKNKER